MAVKRNFIWMTMGRGVFAVCQWLLVMIIAKQGTAVNLGEYTYALALTGPIVMFSQLNLRAFMATDAIGEFEFEDYMTTRLLAAVFTLIVVAVIVLLKDIPLSFLSLIFIVAMFKIFESLSDIFYGILQKKERMSFIAFSLMLHGVVAVLCMQSAMIFKGNVIHGGLAITICWFLILIVFDKRVAHNKCFNVNSFAWANQFQLISKCLPLGIVMGLIALRIAVPTYFVEAHFGLAKVGHYSAVLYFLIAGNLIISSLIQAAAPRLSHYYHFQKEMILGFMLKLMTIAVVLGALSVIGATLFGDLILSVIYGNHFEIYGNLLSWIICAGAFGFVAQIMGLVLTVARLFKYQVYANIVGVTFVLVVSYFFVPKYGLQGGAFALISGNVAVFMSNLISIMKNKVITFA